MSFRCRQRAADSPLVQNVWQVQHDAPGCYLAAAHGGWDVLVVQEGQDTRLFFGGPKTKAMPIPYSAGSRCFGIRFQVGVYLTRLPAQSSVDSMKRQVGATRQSFWLEDAALPFPDYDTAEAFVARLERDNLLVFDSVIGAALQNQEQPLPARSLQRRFLRTTGLSQSTLRQITRANQAAALLAQGRAIPDVVHEAGYTDQPHLTKAFKRFIGHTPAQFKQLHLL